MCMPGVCEVIYKFLDCGADKKNLSEVCRASRRAFLDEYFPSGLRPAPMRLAMGSQWGESSPTRKCNAPGCKKTGYIVKNMFGMISQTKIGGVVHCGKRTCREAVMKKSFEHAIHALLRDGGNGHYMSRDDYVACLEKLFSKNCGDFCKQKALHDHIIQSMIKHLCSSDTSSPGAKECSATKLLLLAGSLDEKNIENLLAQEKEINTDVIYVRH